MKIAVTADPHLPVPPELYGGIERIVNILVRGLVHDGYDVTLFAHPGSDVPCSLHPYPRLDGEGLKDVLANMRHVSETIFRKDYGVVHSFGRLAYLLPTLPLPVPKLMSYQRSITRSSVRWGERLARGTLHFSGCSHHLIKPFANGDNWHVVYNGVSREAYTYEATVPTDAPLVFLGRIERIKGPHLAIQVAKESDRSLIMAGNVEEEHRDYFKQNIEPHLDSAHVKYIGPVTDDEKDALLGSAGALLMPILWEEPFGIVMAEALACGTPVVGFERGSVPEIVEHGVNGYVCRSVDDMIDAVSSISFIERRDCRRIMEDRFSARALVDGYKKVYRQMLGEV